MSWQIAYISAPLDMHLIAVFLLCLMQDLDLRVLVLREIELLALHILLVYLVELRLNFGTVLSLL